MTNRDTLVNFWEVLTDEEKDLLVKVINSYMRFNKSFVGVAKIHLGSLPFFNREMAIAAIDRELGDNSYDTMSQSEFMPMNDDRRLSEIRNKLDIEVWVDITCVGDTNRRVLNTITGEERQGWAMTRTDKQWLIT